MHGTVHTTGGRVLFGRRHAAADFTGPQDTTFNGFDDPAGWSYQPDEPPLQLTTEHLEQVQATLKAHNLQPGRYVLPQMIITPVG